MNQEQIRAFAEEQHYNYLGDFLIDVDEPLTDEERLELASRQANALCEINRLEGEKKERNAEYKHLIDERMEEANDVAFEFKRGKKKTSRELPAFYDPDSKQRVFIDMDTGEEIMRQPAEKGDAQMKI